MTASRRIALVRHPTPDVALGRCYGRLDVRLAASAATEIAAILAGLGDVHPVRVWSSPALRCRTVATAIGAARSVATQVDARLQELDFGAWEGLAWDDIARAELDRWARAPLDFAPPDGEPGYRFAARIAEFHAMLAAQDGDAVVVTHGGPLRLLGALLRGEPIDLLGPTPPFGSVQIVAIPFSAQGPPPSR